MKIGKWLMPAAIAVLALGAVPTASLAGGKQLQKKFSALHGKIATVSEEHGNLAPSGLAKRARQTQRAMKKFSKDDLDMLGDLLVLAPNWRQIGRLLDSALEAQAAATAASTSCPAGLPGGIQDWYIARDVAQGLDFAQVFAPDDLVTVALGAGGTVGPHPIKVALQVSYEAAQTAALVLEQIYFINDECEENAHRALLREVNEKIDGIDQQIKTVKAAQRQILRLLLIDDAEDRWIDPAVLTCTGDDCPQVIDCPGTECRGELEDDD